MHKIPVYRPYLHGNERKYVNECLDSTWISSKGPFIDQFEKCFREYVSAPFAISVSNGTVALHLAFLGVGIGPGDEVIVPTLTFIASVNAIAYTGATPVFADSIALSWQMDPNDVLRKITPKTRAILTVHLYGHPCEIETLRQIADRHGLFLIEDSAEAFGSCYKNRHIGNFGAVSTFSFFGNKTITTGEGGMVVIQERPLYEKISALKNQGNDPLRTYWHTMIGYNYRMTNLSASIGLAQLEQADEILKKKRLLATMYREYLQNLPLQIHREDPHCTHSYWMISILVDHSKDREPLRNFLFSHGVETRPFFYPIHQLPMYQHLESGRSCPTAENLSARGINLPSFPDLTESEVKYICQQISIYFHKNHSSFSGAADTPEALQRFN